MECKKCGQIIPENNKFCSNCGSKVEKTIYDIGDTIKKCQRIWYIFGFLRGVNKDSKDKKWFENLEKSIREEMPETWKEYQEVIQFWIDFANKNGKNKETFRPKRKSISEAKTMQKK